MKENMATNNKPAFEIFVVREGSNKKSYFTKIGAAWPTKSGSGYNADLIALPVDGKFILLPPKDKTLRSNSDRTAQRRLRNFQVAGPGGDAAALHDANKGAEQGEVIEC